MPDFRFVCAEPTFQPSSGYASRISLTVWSQYEELVRRLHTCGTTRDDILRTLIHEHDFQPSIGQLRDQMARWGLKSSRKNKSRGSSDRENISGSGSSSSESRQEPHLRSQPARPSYVYNDVLDSAFDSMWLRYDMGILQYQTAIEMEILADMLFLGGRFVAAFNLYSSIYSAACFTHRNNGEALTETRFRALLGCLRSSGNLEQRRRIVSCAERELELCGTNNCCRPDEMDVDQRSEHGYFSTMSQFHERENFRHAMSTGSDSTTVNDVIKELEMDQNYGEVLRWCLDQLVTDDFLSLYNEHLQNSGSGVACLTYGGSQATIYWYLLVHHTMGVPYTDANPRFTIRHTTGSTYRFSTWETLALAAAMISSEPWLFSLDQLSSHALNNWIETLIVDNSLFHSVFQQAIKTTLVPSLSARVDKSSSDAIAAANGYQAYRMPSVGILKGLATRLSQADAATSFRNSGHGIVNADNGHQIAQNSSTFERLTREYLTIIKSYVTENCAYETHYQLRERPQPPAPPALPAMKISRPSNIRSHTNRSHLVGSCDPPLNPSIRGSTASSSFRSFQSTHLRTKRIGLKLSDLEAMSIDTKASSDASSMHFAFSVGVR